MNSLEIFKNLGVLYLVMQQMIIPIDSRSVLELDMPLQKTRLNIERQNKEHDTSSDKLPAYTYNSKSEKNIDSVSVQAIIHSKTIAPYGEYTKELVLPKPIISSKPIVPEITITPTVYPTQIPIPTIRIPDEVITIIPLPSIHPKCGCDPVVEKNMDVYCPMYIREMPCADIEHLE